jgi:hypothetical protein
MLTKRKGRTGLKKGVRHQKKFERWVNQAEPSTAFLARAAESCFALYLQSQGFERADIEHGSPNYAIEANELCFEKLDRELLQEISIRFDHLGGPRFQVRATLRYPEIQENGVYSIVRYANLVGNKQQYVKLWGKAWLTPSWLWPQKRYLNLVEQVLSMLDQLVIFLDTGERGTNVSEDPMGR